VRRSQLQVFASGGGIVIVVIIVIVVVIFIIGLGRGNDTLMQILWPM
jgi:hypothetical protein